MLNGNPYKPTSMTHWRWSWLNLCNMRIWKSSGVYLSCRRFGPPVVSAWFEAKACCIAYCYPFITILVPSYYHLISSTYGSEMQHLQKRVPRFVRQQLSCSHCFRLHLRGLGFQHRILQVTDPDILFKLLDDGDKQLTAESFLQLQHLTVRSIKHEHCHFALRKSWVRGVDRLKGNAKSIDLEAFIMEQRLSAEWRSPNHWSCVEK